MKNMSKINLTYFPLYLDLIIFLLKIFFVRLSSINNIRQLDNHYSEIHLVIQGSGVQNLLSDSFTPTPSMVLVNGEKDDSCSKTCNLQGDKNNIILKYQNQLNSCEKMFSGLNNIIAADLSYFDTSQVTSMKKMFMNCQYLEKIIFGNIDTSSLKDMQALFNSCLKLTSADLSNFDTSKVTIMKTVFYDCKNIEKINLGNMNTSSVTDMQSFFSGCEKITYLDLSSFNISKVTTINHMFAKCTSLTHLNIKYFEFPKNIIYNGTFKDLTQNVIYCIENTEIIGKIGTNIINDCNDIGFKEMIKTDLVDETDIDPCQNINYKYKYINKCYIECPEDTYPIYEINNDDFNKIECYKKTPEGYYLDVNNRIYKKCFESCNYCHGEGNGTNHNCIECKANYAFYNNYLNISNCYEKCDYYYYFDNLNNYHCNGACPEEYNKLILNKNKCIDNCKKDDIYKYEYNNNCYINCPDNTYPLENEDYICHDETPEEYSFNSEKEITRKCYETCKNCDKLGNLTHHECIECKDNYMFYNNNLNITNCYQVCNYYHYFDDLNEFHCTRDCQGEGKKLIIDEKKCVDDCKSDKNYKYEYKNTCYKECPKGTITNINDYSCNDYNNIESTILIDINTIFNESNYLIEINEEINKFREIISDFNISDENEQEIITKKDNIQFQMTTTEIQRNNTNKNVSTLNLGDCEKILKSVYNIDQSLPLIIFKIDYFSPDTLIPIIGYEIYHPLNRSKLDLKYCEDILIKLNIPVSIDESKLFKYDPNNEYYTDNCFPYTTDNGTDIILADRKQEFTDNNLSLCEKNCNYTGYDLEDKQSTCDCVIKNKMDLISEIIEDPNKLLNNFDSEENFGSSNIISIKCTQTLFSKEGLKNNISGYVITIFISQFLLSTIFFIRCGYDSLVDEINIIIEEKEKIQNKGIILKNKISISPKRPKKKKKYTRNKINFPPKKYNLNFINNNTNLPNHIYDPKSGSMNNLASSNLINEKCKDNLNQKSKNVQDNILNIDNDKNESKIEKIQNKFELSYNDYELNTLEYKYALIYDKRTFCTNYISSLKEKNLIIFSFCPRKDYNSIIIRLCIFSLSFSIYYAINFSFFNEKILHKIYEEGGKYDTIYFFPKIIISFFISYYTTSIIKIIFLSERDIVQVKHQIPLQKAIMISERVRKNIKIKYTVFFISGLAFLVFFWMLLSSFGAVYPNTQMFIFKNTLISFAISLIYPCFIYILPCALRKCSLNSAKKNKICIYRISKLMQMF